MQGTESNNISSKITGVVMRTTAGSMSSLLGRSNVTASRVYDLFVLIASRGCDLCVLTQKVSAIQFGSSFVCLGCAPV
jgi:hypothetical protein